MLYELSCLINPDFSQEQAEEFVQKLEGLVSIGGKVVKKDLAKKIGLAYAIKKQTSAFLLSIIFESTSEKIEELQKKLDGDSEIIRFLLIKTKIEKDRPPRIAPKITGEDASSASLMADKSVKTKDSAKILGETPAETKTDKGEEKLAKKIEKESTTKVEMEKIETELNKILDESQ